MPKSQGGPDMTGSFRSTKINLIALTIYYHTAKIVSDKADKIVKLSEMMTCQHRAVQEVAHMVVCPHAMKMCKLVCDETPITIPEILNVNTKGSIQKDCHSRSKNYGAWSLDGLLPRLEAGSQPVISSGHEEVVTEVHGAVAPPANVPTPFTKTNVDMCKGLFCPFFRCWRCIGTSKMIVREERHCVTQREEMLLRRSIAPVRGRTDLVVGPRPTTAVGPAVGESVQHLPAIPLEPLTKTRWPTKG